MDLLGEAVLSEAEADDYLRRYLELLATVAGRRRGSAADAERVDQAFGTLRRSSSPRRPMQVTAEVRARLLPLLRTARELGVFVNVDMEQYRSRTSCTASSKTCCGAASSATGTASASSCRPTCATRPGTSSGWRTLAQRRGTPFTRAAGQGRLLGRGDASSRSQNDWPVPVFEDKAATDASTSAARSALLAAWPHLRPAFGTHNPRIDQRRRWCEPRRAGLPRDDIEFQMLYGMAEGLREAVRAAGLSHAGLRARGRRSSRAWRTWCGGCWRTRRTSRGSSRGTRRATRQTCWRRQRRRRRGRAQARPPFVNAPPAEFYRPSVRGRDGGGACSESREERSAREYPLLIGVGASVSRLTRADEVRYPAEPGTRARPWWRRRRCGQSTTRSRRRGTALPGLARPTRPASGRRILRRAADLLEQRRFEFAAHDGVRERQALGRGRRRRDRGDRLPALLRAAGGATAGGRRRSWRCRARTTATSAKPRGVAAIIAPWNFPLAIICGMTTAALAAGTARILKPAEQSPIIAARAGRAAARGGRAGRRGAVPARAGRGRGKALVEHPGVRLIAFTGSNAVGLGIIRAAAEMRPGQREREARHRGDGRQERDHRGRGRGPRPGGDRRGGLGIRLRGAEVQRLQPRDRRRLGATTSFARGWGRRWRAWSSGRRTSRTPSCRR